MTKPRTGIPGVSGLSKVVNEESWGAAKATERYGGSTLTFGPPKDMSAPQDPMAKRGPDWADDHADNWVRGGGPKQAEGRPGYVPGYRPRGK